MNVIYYNEKKQIKGIDLNTHISFSIHSCDKKECCFYVETNQFNFYVKCGLKELPELRIYNSTPCDNLTFLFYRTNKDSSFYTMKINGGTQTFDFKKFEDVEKHMVKQIWEV